jgi:deoxyhypusine synthase
MTADNPDGAPIGATDAVLKPSAPVEDGAIEVKGVEFNHYKLASITVEQLVQGMSNMGFQATSIGEAVRVINGMVCSRQ